MRVYSVFFLDKSPFIFVLKNLRKYIKWNCFVLLSFVLSEKLERAYSCNKPFLFIQALVAKNESKLKGKKIAQSK